MAERFGLELRDFPFLYHTLSGYALLPIICRRKEGSHSEFTQISANITVGQIAWRAAAVRRPEVVAELDRQRASPSLSAGLIAAMRKSVPSTSRVCS